MVVAAAGACRVTAAAVAASRAINAYDDTVEKRQRHVRYAACP
jgi:hypothetical protein